jgi:hypothetical protein
MLPAMDIQTMWIIVAAVSTPIAGVVGFAIQLRQVEKARLENEKLKLELVKLAGEIENLQHQSNKTQSRIVVATDRQVAQFNDMDIKFSRKRQGPTVFRTEAPAGTPAHEPRAVRWVLTAAGIAFLAFLAWAYWPR